MTKVQLKNTSPSLTELLYGHLKDIAEATGYNPQVVGRMLRGEEGYSDEGFEKVLSESINTLERKAAYLNEQVAKWRKFEAEYLAMSKSEVEQ